MRILSMGICASALLMTGCQDDNGNNVIDLFMSLGCDGGSSSGTICDILIGGRIAFDMSGPVLATAVTPGDIEIDVTGSSVGMPTTGYFLVTLRDGDGAALVQTVAGWSRSGNSITVTDPAALETWIANQSVSAREFTIASVGLEVQTSPGFNTVVTEVQYDGSQVANATEGWLEPCEGGSPQWQDPFTCL